MYINELGDDMHKMIRICETRKFESGTGFTGND